LGWKAALALELAHHNNFKQGWCLCEGLLPGTPLPVRTACMSVPKGTSKDA